MKEVAAVAILNDHHILMGKRRNSLKWTNPGGHLNPKEDPLAGAAREVREETGLDLNPHNFVHMETRVIKKPSGESIKVHGYKVNLLKKAPTTVKIDPDEEVQKWQWIKLDGGLSHIKDDLHVPLGDNVLLDNLFREGNPVKRHTGRFWRAAKTLGKDSMEEIKDKLVEEGPKAIWERKKKKEQLKKTSAEIVRGGKADWMSDGRFSDKQLRMGITIEKEHTTNPRIAKEIAKDHLTEDKNYYTHLKEMEDKYVEKKAFWIGFGKTAEDKKNNITPYMLGGIGGTFMGAGLGAATSPHHPPLKYDISQLTDTERESLVKSMDEAGKRPQIKKTMLEFDKTLEGKAAKALANLKKIETHKNYGELQKHLKQMEVYTQMNPILNEHHLPFEARKMLMGVLRENYGSKAKVRKLREAYENIQKDVAAYTQTPAGKRALAAGGGKTPKIEPPAAFIKAMRENLRSKHLKRVGLGALAGVGTGLLGTYIMD